MPARCRRRGHQSAGYEHTCGTCLARACQTSEETQRPVQVRLLESHYPTLFEGIAAGGWSAGLVIM
jgi:hypothetical protein